MTDKQLDEAALEYAANIRHEDSTVWDGVIWSEIFKAGAAYQLKRMRCGECRHRVASYCVRNGDIIGDSFVPKDFGCICFEAKEGEK